MKHFYSRFLFTICFGLLCQIQTFAQGEMKLRSLFIEAESYYLFEEYKEALPLYQRIIRNDPDNYNVKYRIGVCYLRGEYQKEKSIKYLEEAARNSSPDSKPSSFKERRAPEDSYYFLAEAYRVNNQLDKALENYHKFKNLVDPGVYDIDLVNEEIKACQVAKELIKSPIYFKSGNKGEPVNTRFAEVNPVISGDGNTLVFTRKLQFYDGVFYATKNAQGKWSEPRDLTPEFGLDGNSYVTGISYAGDELYIYRSDEYDGNIYYSKLENGRWSTLMFLNQSINTKYWESHASPSPDNQYLYFTSNREGGYGGLDIYRAKKTPKGNWGEPVNLGPIVNSPFNENTPFISHDGSILFFSSQGHKTMGGYDLFSSRNIGPETWSKPVNMGYPLNSTDDDLFFCPSGDLSLAVYSMYNEQTSHGLMDIYQVEIYNEMIPRSFVVAGSISASENLKLSKNNVQVSLISDASNSIIDQSTIDDQGSFELDATQGEYKLFIDGKGIKPVTVPVVIAVTSDNNRIVIPEIVAEQATGGEDILVVPPGVLPTLEVAQENYVVSDSLPVEIDLILEKKSMLQVEIYNEDEYVRTEQYEVNKKKFTYLFTPIPGENLIRFTIADKDGNFNNKSVYVVYHAAEPTKQEILLEPVAAIEINDYTSKSLIYAASPALQQYLLLLDLDSFDSLYDLYNQLISDALENGYTVEDVQNLFSIYLTQREIEDFLTDLYTYKDIESGMSDDTLNTSGIVPLQFLGYVNKSKPLVDGAIDIPLTEISYSLAGEQLSGYKYVLTFSGQEEISIPEGIENKETHDQYLTMFAELGDSVSRRLVSLASSTISLIDFYQSLLTSSTTGLKDYLLTLDFEEAGVNNSIDLVNHLFDQAGDNTYSIEELFSALEIQKSFNRQFLEMLVEILANEATGDLKLLLEELNIDNEQVNSFESLIDYMIKESTGKSYTRENVYKHLIDLIGIDNVDIFAQKLSQYAHGDLKTAIEGCDLNIYSSPLELIQYLLSLSSDMSYTNSDINNLLLKILLEKDLKEYYREMDEISPKELMRNKTFVQTIVLVNIILIILLVLFIRRNKNKAKS